MHCHLYKITLESITVNVILHGKSYVFFYIKLETYLLITMNPLVLYITAAAVLRLSLNPLVLMDGPVKASQDAGNRITANRILDQEEKKRQRHAAHE